MTYPERMFIADVAGPPGSSDELAAWCGTVVGSLSGVAGIERIGRYRKLNEERALVAGDVTSDDAVAALTEAFSAPPSPFRTITAVGQQKGEGRRADAAADPRECPLLYTVDFPVPPQEERDLAESVRP